MRVNRKSWHYWLASVYGRKDAPRDLCRYFWSCVGHAALLVFMAVWAFVAASCVIGMGLWLSIGIGFVSIATGGEGWQGWFQFTGAIGFLFFCVALAGFVIFGIPYWLKSRDNEKPTSFIGKYIAARKSKICPLIEVIDE